jgi:hypothetical protein
MHDDDGSGSDNSGVVAPAKDGPSGGSVKPLDVPLYLQNLVLELNRKDEGYTELCPNTGGSAG